MRSVIRISIVMLGAFATVCLPIRRASAELPPEMMVDKYLIHAEQLHTANDYGAAFDVMQKIVALQKAHSLTVSDDFHFKYAQVALSADSMRIALESVTRYLSATGKEGQHYQEALKVMLKAEGNEVMAPDDFYNEVIKPQGTCQGLPEGSGCWQELTNHPECYVWNAYLSEGESALWTGKCSGHVPDGKGTLSWYFTTEKYAKLKTSEKSGLFRKGKMEGKWAGQSWDYDSVGRLSVTSVSEATYENGKRHGLANLRSTYYSHSGDVKDRRQQIFLYLDGKASRFETSQNYYEYWLLFDWSVDDSGLDENGNGHLVFRGPDGSEWGGALVNWTKDGKWVVKNPGYNPGTYTESEGSYVNGRRHGHWVTRDSDANVLSRSSYTLVDGKFDVQRVYQPDGTLNSKYSRFNGKRHGEWVNSHPDGTVKRAGSYVEGKKAGKWLYRDPKGTEWGGTYVEGKKHGEWVENLSSDDDNYDYDKEGKFWHRGKETGPWYYGIRTAGKYGEYGGYIYGQGAYLDDVRNGEWVERFSNGVKMKGVYQDGKRYGTWLQYDQNEKRCWSVTYRQGRRVNNEKVKKKICQQTAW